jgi:hypothetical protein
MAEQRQKYTSTFPKVIVIGTGIATVLSGLYGLYLSFKSVLAALEGGFTAHLEQHEVPYFYPAFYSMLSVTVVCCLILAWCGIDQIRLRLAHFRLFVGVFIFEIFYFAFIGGFLWLLPSVGMSVGAATGVANYGLMPAFFMLLPLWAPLSLGWAKKRLINRTSDHPIAGFQMAVERRRDSITEPRFKTKFLTSLVGGIGGAGSSFLVLSVTMSFGGFNFYISHFTAHAVTFFLGGVCVIYSANLDSRTPQRLSIYMQIVLLIIASYLAAWLRAKNLSFFSLFPIAVISGSIVNGFSFSAVRSGLWAFAGAVFGMAILAIALSVLAALNITSSEDIWRSLDPAGVSFPIMFMVAQLLVWYGLTVALLFSRIPVYGGNLAVGRTSSSTL